MAEQYTSNQYKYLLIKRLQRHFSMKNSYDRAYTQSFFWELFDDSVTVTEEAYNNFCRLMDDNLAFCAEKGWYLCENIDLNDEGAKEQGVLLVNAFAEIGITLVIEENYGVSGTATFTKSNGKVMSYSANITGKNYFYINARAGTEYRYAKASAPAYNMQGMDVPEELGNPKSAGPGTYWSYNADTKTMTISGDGAYAGSTDEAQLGSGAYTTVILGANVSRLLANCMVNSEKTLVLLHPADGKITIDPKFNAKSGSCGDTYLSLDVYTDCEVAKEALSTETQSKYITLHSLSKWEG